MSTNADKSRQERNVEMDDFVMRHYIYQFNEDRIETMRRDYEAVYKENNPDAVAVVAVPQQVGDSIDYDNHHALTPYLAKGYKVHDSFCFAFDDLLEGEIVILFPEKQSTKSLPTTFSPNYLVSLTGSPTTLNAINSLIGTFAKRYGTSDPGNLCVLLQSLTSFLIGKNKVSGYLQSAIHISPKELRIRCHVDSDRHLRTFVAAITECFSDVSGTIECIATANK